MSIGYFVRQLLGPLEGPISGLYRSMFVDINSLAKQIHCWCDANKILELGCGEGAITSQLVKFYPHAYITAIDITPRVGRMFQGDLSRVTFKVQTIRDCITEEKADFDLVVISDVIHHVPWNMHREFLSDAGQALKPGGYLILKDWERSSTPIHLLAYFLDRYITGDKVRYKTTDEFRMLLEDVFGANCIKAEKRIRPWSNNIAFLVKGMG
jgi:2-polyprenyl-6-hydroxyphenyl methylase/3-demethylubiquinone-9 3-methyltransferase